jgi:mRNA interferase MazF
MRRGEVWWAELPPPWGRRPVLLVARDEAYRFLRWVLVAPLTGRIRDLPTTVLLDPVTDRVPQASVVQLDAIQPIDREWLEAPITTLEPVTMRAVDRAIEFALGLRR